MPVLRIRPAKVILKKSNFIYVYSDGSGPARGASGFAAVCYDRGMENTPLELIGYEAESNSQRAELLAALLALEYAPWQDSRKIFVLRSDSLYLVNGINGGLAKWRRAGWIGYNGPIKNMDLWLRVEAAMGRHSIVTGWVKGHASDPNNERADWLSKVARLRWEEICGGLLTDKLAGVIIL